MRANAEAQLVCWTRKLQTEPDNVGVSIVIGDLLSGSDRGQSAPTVGILEEEKIHKTVSFDFCARA